MPNRSVDQFLLAPIGLHSRRRPARCRRRALPSGRYLTAARSAARSSPSTPTATATSPRPGPVIRWATPIISVPYPADYVFINGQVRL